jgi:hypothetical protein
MTNVSINLSKEEIKVLNKRAKSNLMSLREQVEDIIRRSVVSSRKRSYSVVKVKDKLVGIFSRERKGRKPKRL